MTKKISDKDKKDWEKFISRNDKLPNKDLKRKKENYYITKSIDLHGYTLEEANKSIQDLINKSHEESINKLIVVTGKGLHSNNEKDPYVSKDFSILKHSVPEFIKKNIELMKKISEIKGAKIEDGGDGAFYIYLKRKK
ncbi:Smr/MutS family protein [Candidatus Pelagibacter bacterium nBUS_29]|uniref:Smr/MutS family protein n=1 Tax=Candidatus Pelagibacter bacterium nBUS_29 TaxID=3374190 RepID=UPI003EB89A21